MARVNQSAQYFVVGGPVQPDRACYIERRTDAELLQGIVDQQFCYVLSPRATGKSSLMANTIRSLRREGQLAAVVDLTQIASRGDSDDAGRWYYSIAYRILRELRIKADLQSWWQDKSALYSEQRLVEFFWEIVLAGTKEPVTIFLDEIERAANLPFAEKLFAAIRTCYARRVSEPNFERLNFVVLGVSTPAELCPNESLSPFIDGRALELPDFTLEETARLAAGFGCDAELGRSLMKRIFAWTQGQPYLTQKLARAVARKDGRPDDVDRVVHEQFLAPGVSHGDPLLSHIRSRLTAETPVARQALGSLSKIARGREVTADQGSSARVYLQLTGVVRRDSDNRLRLRNEIFRQVFDSVWTSSARRGSRRRNAALMAAAAGVALIAFWYTQVLPRPYIDTLSVVTADYGLAEDAYLNLRRLPGFAGTADRLLAEAMTRRSAQATVFDDVLAADVVLRELLGRDDLADRLLGEYWLKRSAEAANAQQRDAAIVLAAKAGPSLPEATAAVIDDLAGSDYRQLRRSVRLPEIPNRWEIDWQRGELIVVDEAHRVQRFALAGGDGLAGARRVADRLTALQHVPVTRELNVDENGDAGAFELLLTLQHAKASDLLVTLTGPSGRQATLTLPEPGTGRDSLQLSANGTSPLAELASEQRRGVWRLSIVDRRSEEVGSLLGWGLRFAGSEAVIRDEPEQGMALPDPARTDEVEIELSENGRIALSRPTRAGIAGSLAVWDLIGGELLNDLQLTETPRQVAFSAAAGRAIVIGDETLTIWDANRPAPATRLAVAGGDSVSPAVSVDGGFVAIAEAGRFGRPNFSLLRVDDGARLATVDGIAGMRDWLLGPRAAYLAILTPARQVRVIDPLSGRLLADLRHRREIERMIAVADAALLLTVDSGGDIEAWRLPLPESGVESVSGALVGTTIDPSSVSVAADSRVVAFQASGGHVEVRHLSGAYGPHRFRLDGLQARVGTRVSPDGSQLLTANGAVFRVWALDQWPDGSNADLQFSALAVDRRGRTAVLGFRDGHVEFRALADFTTEPPPAANVNFIGHRGPITSLAVNASHSIVVSGGADGVARVWDLVTAAPREFFLRHPVAPVNDVDISDDGRLVASAAEYSARVWRAADGRLVGEIPANGAAVAVAFAPGSEMLAVGDSAGNLFFGWPRSSDPWLSARAEAALSAIAFSPDSATIASGDVSGNLQLWDVATGEPTGEPYPFRHAISSLGFTADGRHLLLRSGHWLHRLRIADGALAVERTLPVEAGPEATAMTGDPQQQRYLRIVAGPGPGRAIFYDAALGERPGSESASAQPLERDWQAVLGLAVDAGTGNTLLLR